jgi:spore germination cell wall hydrolase CwlJ-like protein
VRNSAFGTIHAASLSFPRLVGASIPDPYFTQLAAIDPRALEATGSIPLEMPLEPVVTPPSYDFPTVDRRLKGDRLDVKTAPPEAPSRPNTRPKTKDVASIPPEPEVPSARRPVQPQTEVPAAQAALPKGDRVTPSAAGIDEARSSQPYRRFGVPVGQATLAKRVLGPGSRKPFAIATAVEPARAPVAAVEAEVTVAAAPVKPLRRGGLASVYINQARREAQQIASSARAIRTEPFETADLESQRADLAGPLTPPPARPADSSVTTTPQPAPAIAEAASASASDQPAREPQHTVEIEPESRAQKPEVASVPHTAPGAQDGSGRAAAGAAGVKTEKTPDRFNAEAAERLASFAKPAAENRVYFGTHALGIGRNSWEAWDADETPTVLAPPHVDTEIKRAARDPAPDTEAEKGGETIAPKGEVTGEGKRPRTPAERLNLTGAARAKHQKCLANAIYFEARGEVERGQMAVAQVVLNRVFSGYYPGNVCDVVYQNAHRHLACQFTFACDNHRDIVRDQPRWELADRIASDALDGKFWLPEIGKATHYHATYVNPWWVRTMTKHSRIGVHIFYRPTRWGTLDEIPVWGDRLEVTGAIKREASPASPEKKNEDKRADAQPARPVRRSIFDPVEPINLPGG